MRRRYATLQPTHSGGEFFRKLFAKSIDPKDGDGDGYIRDGEPDEAPAQPKTERRTYSKEKLVQQFGELMQQSGLDPAERWTRERGYMQLPSEDVVKAVAAEQQEHNGKPATDEVKRSYAVFRDALFEQFEALQRSGLKVHAWKGEGEPYHVGDELWKPNSDLMRQRVEDEGRFYFFMTQNGFGAQGATESNAHPMLAKSPYKTEDGDEMLVNDVFRVVHDAVAHIQAGYSFSTRGEMNGMVAHATTLPKEAHAALFAETFAQNSVYEITGKYSEQNTYISKHLHLLYDLQDDAKKTARVSKSWTDREESEVDDDEPLGAGRIRRQPQRQDEQESPEKNEIFRKLFGKSIDPKDGDGDGYINDGQPDEAPAPEKQPQQSTGKASSLTPEDIAAGVAEYQNKRSAMDKGPLNEFRWALMTKLEQQLESGDETHRDAYEKMCEDDYTQNGVKSKSFKNWFGDWENPDADSSQAVDDEGKPERSKPFSEALDEDGEPIIVYHGTTHEFDEFKDDRGNPENSFGVGHYFTTDAGDVETNYAGEGPDLRNRIDGLSDELSSSGQLSDIMTEVETLLEELAIDASDGLSDEELQSIRDIVENTDMPERPREHFIAKITENLTTHGLARFDLISENELGREWARGELAGDSQRTIRAFLNVRNPVHLQKDGGTRFDISVSFDEETEEETISEGFQSMKDAISTVWESYENESGVTDGDDLFQALIGPALENGEESITAQQIKENLDAWSGDGNMITDPETGQGVSGQFLRDLFIELGHDSIVDHMPAERFGMGIEDDAKHYIVFDAKQIKSEHNRGTFDRKSPKFEKGFLGKLFTKSATEPKDGDGDGYVDDGKETERPAQPRAEQQLPKSGASTSDGNLPEFVSRVFDLSDAKYKDWNDTVGGAFAIQDGIGKAFHVTDNPESMQRAIRNGSFAEHGQGLHRELGSGFYVSDRPEMWSNRSTQKWDFLNTIDDDQKTKLLNALEDDVNKRISDKYIADFEGERALRDLRNVESGTIPFDSLVTLAAQPINIPFDKAEYLEKIGIEQAKPPAVIPVDLKGKFAELKSHITEEQQQQLRDMGFDGAFTRAGMGTNPELVVWNKSAILSFDGQSLPKSAGLPPLKIGDRVEIPANNTTDAFAGTIVEHEGEIGVKPDGKDHLWGERIPLDLMPRWLQELRGEVTLSDEPSGNDSVDKVLSGSGTFLGRGHGGMVFDAGDGNVVKAATITPYHWTSGVRSEKSGNEKLQGEIDIANKLHSLGIDGVLPMTAVMHDGRLYAVREKIALGGIDQQAIKDAGKSLEEMHKHNIVMKDMVQIGMGADGRFRFFDVGEADSVDPNATWTNEDKDNDHSSLKREAEKLKLQYETPREQGAYEKWEAEAIRAKDLLEKSTDDGFDLHQAGVQLRLKWSIYEGSPQAKDDPWFEAFKQEHEELFAQMKARAKELHEASKKTAKVSKGFLGKLFVKTKDGDGDGTINDGQPNEGPAPERTPEQKRKDTVTSPQFRKESEEKSRTGARSQNPDALTEHDLQSYARNKQHVVSIAQKIRDIAAGRGDTNALQAALELVPAEDKPTVERIAKAVAEKQLEAIAAKELQDWQAMPRDPAHAETILQKTTAFSHKAPPEFVQQQQQAIREVLTKMPTAHSAFVSERLQAVSIAANTDEVATFLAIETLDSHAEAAGAFVSSTGKLVLDGVERFQQLAAARGTTTDAENIMDTLQGLAVHELAHAVDSGKRISGTEAWQAAWESEVIDRDRNVPDRTTRGFGLSEYAATTPSEGWAEFYRYVHEQPEKAIRHFPRCWSVFKSTLSGQQPQQPQASAAFGKSANMQPEPRTQEKNGVQSELFGEPIEADGLDFPIDTFHPAALSQGQAPKNLVIPRGTSFEKSFVDKLFGKSTEPKDGDGDGYVRDGQPDEAPAPEKSERTEAERRAGIDRVNREMTKLEHRLGSFDAAIEAAEAITVDASDYPAYADAVAELTKSIDPNHWVPEDIWAWEDETDGQMEDESDDEFIARRDKAQLRMLIRSTIVDTLNDTKLPIEKRKNYLDSMENVLLKMTGGAMQRLDKNLLLIKWHKTQQELVTEHRAYAASIGHQVSPMMRPSGICYSYADGRGKSWLSLNGGGVGIKQGEVYAHEIGHVVDMVGKESDWISNSEDWKAAWSEEAKGISDYATTESAEGFAEFARLLWSADIPAKEIAEKFPKMWAVAKKHNLVRG